ncbi:MAG: hypothetical protein HY858_01610 [Candidatus Solibacter usitatus]|nr:hypothetical protein [Candidatus Solibacter usitatus]
MATAEEGSIVAIAAESREFAGLLAHASSVSRLDWGIDFARRAAIGGEPWILAANGPGPNLAAQAASAALRQARPRALLSTGFCGGLDPALAPGDVFVASRILAPSSSREFFPLPAPSARPHAAGNLISIDRVAVTSAERRTLSQSGGRAVDMEAAAVAGAAERYETPFYCIRVVSDTAGEEMPLDFNRYRDAAGRFSRGRIVAAALLRPASIPGLWRLDARCRRAAVNLGDFLADCRF